MKTFTTTVRAVATVQITFEAESLEDARECIENGFKWEAKDEMVMDYDFYEADESEISLMLDSLEEQP